MLLSSSRRSGSGLALCAASVVVLAAAFLLWEARSEAASNALANTSFDAAESSTGNASYSTPASLDATAALKLLRRSFLADKALFYSADVVTTATYGERQMQTSAHLTRAPRRLTISYLSGDRRGLTAGYNERWFWRRETETAPMQAYASVALRPDEMAALRFALLERNYRGVVMSREAVDKRLCDVVEVRRNRPLANSSGPFKRLWLDRETGLTLRADSYNCHGNLVQRSVLSDVQMKPKVSDQTFVSPAKMFAIAQKTSWTNEELGSDRIQVEAKTKIAPPQPSWLPEGFAFDSVGMHHATLAKSSPLTALSRYSDGLNVITVFAFKTAHQNTTAKTSRATDATKISPEAPSDVSCTFGASAMAMREAPNGLTLIAVGDLPTPMLSRILDSVSAR